MELQASSSGRQSAANSSEILLFSIRTKDSIARSSSSSTNRLSTDYDSPSFHSLSSILNNPHVGKFGVYSIDASWTSWWSPSAAPPEMAPVVVNRTFPNISFSSFIPYINSIADSFARFEDVRQHASMESSNLESSSLGLSSGPGEALVACLREVPTLYFNEDFALEDGATFRASCPFTTISENVLQQEKLSQYLDVVELHLVKEIALRSESFFEAQSQLQALNFEVLDTCSRVSELKGVVRILDQSLVAPAQELQELRATRDNLLELQKKLRLMGNVNQALSDLKLLVEATDCAGALDVVDDLQQLLDSNELAGLHCFRHLQDQLTTTLESINRILSADFIHASVKGIISVDYVIHSTLESRSFNSAADRERELIGNDEETSTLQDRLLPVIVGLLRTGKLPSILRLYHEALVAEMKLAIKNAVAGMLPVLFLRPFAADFSSGEKTELDGGGLSLASKLRNLSAEGFVQLLFAIFKVVQAHMVRAAEIKKVIEWIMCALDGFYGAGDAVTGGSVLVDGNAAQIGQYLPYFLSRATSRLLSVQGDASDVMISPPMSKSFRAEVLRENAEALFAACDAAQGRWAKLLGVRTLLHPKLRLQEFVSIYNLSQEFLIATEKIGGRSGFNIRGTLQSQSKAFLEYQHEARMAKMKEVLDQETWEAVDIPYEFQAIIDWLFSLQKISDGELVDDYKVDTVSHDVTLMSTTDTSSESAIESHTLKLSSYKKHGYGIDEHSRSTAHTLVCQGVGYHMVNCGLILLKMLSEYIDISRNLPSLSPEVVNRVIEVLKLFNMRTCQLVLGAGAMQVSGLKFITAKHLALASQAISFVHALIPDLQRVLLLQIPESKGLVLSDIINKIDQDYKLHCDEIHRKLVQIMRGKILVHLRELPRAVEGWSRVDSSNLQPSQFAKSLAKDIGFLQNVLTHNLHEQDVHTIFRQIVEILHSQLSEAFANLDISSPQVKKGLCQDLQHILGRIQALPSGSLNEGGVHNFGKLDELLDKMVGSVEHE